MFKEIWHCVLYTGIFVSLFVIDYVLGNGFIGMMQKLLCKVVCYVKKTIREEAERTKIEEVQIPINIPILFIELVVLFITRLVLKKYQNCKGKDRFDELLHESKEALRLTDDFLEKWRMRRIPTETSYLDEEPQEITPFKLEVPILHMAIVDTCGSTKLERGDAGDSIGFTESPFFSVVSLVEDGSNIKLNEIDEEPFSDEIKKCLDMQNRYLWDVEEEDPNAEY